MDIIEIIGLIAAVLTTTAFVPQVYKVYKVYKSKSTADISLTMYMVLFVGIVLWLIYGLAKESIPIILANIVTGLLVGFVLILKIKYK